MKIIKTLIVSLLFIAVAQIGLAQSPNVVLSAKNDIKNKTVVFGNSKVKLTLDYNHKAVITGLQVNGEKVVDGNDGMFSKVRTAAATYSTQATASSPIVNVANNVVKVLGITYGDAVLKIHENWTFTITANNIAFSIDRTFSKPALVEEVSFPEINFKSINTWDGAFQGFGGIAWFYLFNEKLNTYGVHTNAASFWNSTTGNGLNVTVDAPGNAVAMKYTHTNDDKLLYSITVSKNEMVCRYDSGTYRTRFIRKKTDVWAPFNIAAGKTTQRISLSYFDYNKVYGRGKFVGVNGKQVSAILNTIARVGVIDDEHFGGNSWHTPYGPICLHEQYIAQMGLGINDKRYLQGYAKCLDFYRDNAIKPDGRVMPRWAFDNSDAMPGTATDKGFYEAQWGYLLDSNPDYVTNVAELYNQTGDKKWVKGQQQACEKSLDWLLNRDSDGNGLVEMMTDSHLQKKSSDWIDIIWASYENAFVNANLYHALLEWADIETQLGNNVKANYYYNFAAKLKVSFNKPTSEGGFWDAEKGCYAYWLDKDKSVHGTNTVTPVNFMAIAYGLCDDSARKKIILDGIETQMQKEQLFFWPLAMYSYQRDEGLDYQYPFPIYENGDLFLSWGSVAVKAYAEYKPELALKYVKNVIHRYSIDGLAYQRYGRVKQDGLGDDILAGNCLSVVGLYQAIYGINPMYNRFYLNPHITPELNGTELKYNFRDQKLIIGLSTNNYAVSNGRYKIVADRDFGFYALHDTLFYFNGERNSASLLAKTDHNGKLTLHIKKWTADEMNWTQSSPNNKTGGLSYKICLLSPNTAYSIKANGVAIGHYKSNGVGSLVFNYNTSITAKNIVIRKD